MQNKSDFALLHPLRVRWAECDAQGIVFNVNYFLFIDVAMTEWLRALGIMGSDTAEFFTVHAEADYRASAKFDDMLDIGVRCVSFGRSSMTLDAGIFRGDQLMTEGKMVYVHADPKTQEPSPIPDDFIQKVLAFEKVTPARA
ncbi:acyl-CoA thioesterase [Hyphococcus lacteus]|uniref:Thioesterase family protein n=1 Tax=Hyphococcus lacteus TaxID=3143536 RepID=A0ABV3Z100_9PROT